MILVRLLSLRSQSEYPLAHMTLHRGRWPSSPWPGLDWGGANLFSSMENVFSIFFRTKGRGYLPQKLMSSGMVVILAVLLSLAATGWPWHRICDSPEK